MHFDILRWLTGLKLYRKTDEKQKYSIYIYIPRLCAFERKDLCFCDGYMSLNRVLRISETKIYSYKKSLCSSPNSITFALNGNIYQRYKERKIKRTKYQVSKSLNLKRNTRIYLTRGLVFLGPRITNIFLVPVFHRSTPNTIHHRGWPLCL